MISQEISTKICLNSSNPECFLITQNDLDLSRSSLNFSQHDFKDWCSTMTIQDLQDCFKIRFPQAVANLKKNWSDNGKNWTLEILEFNIFNATLKNFALNTYKKFTQAILFVSDKDYLDSITFNADCFLFPNKVYQLLSSAKLISNQITKLDKFVTKSPYINIQSQKCIQKDQQKYKIIQLVLEIIEKIQKNIESNMKPQNKVKLKNERQKYNDTIIHQFNHYWRYCSQQEKTNIWYLGYNDIKKAVSKFIQKDFKKFDLYQIQQFLRLSQKVCAKQLKNKVFSWKLNRNDNGITDYMQMVFNQLRIRMLHKCKQSPKSKSKKQRKRRGRHVRRPSISLSETSNETNETDIIYQQQVSQNARFDININEIVGAKIQKIIQSDADNLNQEANQMYQVRIQAYQRLKDLLSVFGISLKLYGSCCCGLAIKNSDVDVTVPQMDLQNVFGYLNNATSRIEAFFQYLQMYFKNFAWISNVKIIKSAAIPIIKFSINTKIPCNLDPSYYTNENFQQQGKVQFDLTVQSTQTSRRHLGIVSTKQTQQWLSQISTLQNVAIIIKNQLALKNLNQTYYGGINTYTLLVMLVAVIRKEALVKQQKVSKVLQKILRFYSDSFDQNKYGIDLHNSQIFYVKEQIKQVITNQSNQCRKLEIKDPQGDHRIITRNCYQFKSIKKLFSQLYSKYFISTRQKIQELCSIWNPKQSPFDQNQLYEWVQKRMDRSCSSQQDMQMVLK